MPVSNKGKSSSSSAHLCDVCVDEDSKYKCPHWPNGCTVRTCSVACSKAHRESCKKGPQAVQTSEQVAVVVAADAAAAAVFPQSEVQAEPAAAAKATPPAASSSLSVPAPGTLFEDKGRSAGVGSEGDSGEESEDRGDEEADYVASNAPEQSRFAALARDPAVAALLGNKRLLQDMDVVLGDESLSMDKRLVNLKRLMESDPQFAGVVDLLVAKLHHNSDDTR